MTRTLPAASLAAPAGLLAAMLHFAGALKSAPPLSALPFDLTLAAAIGLLPSLVLLVAGRRWHVAPSIALPLAACGALWFWLVLAGLWSPSRAVLADKLPEAVLLGPAMLVSGLLVGGDAPTLRRFCDATLVVAVFVAASIAWGLASGAVVLGGLPGADPDRARVQYQITGLALACGAGLAAVRAAEAPGVPRAAAWFLLLLVLIGAALLPGGRVALIGLALAAALAPMVLLWRQGRPLAALAWPAAMTIAAVGGLVLLLADPTLAEGLRTLERLNAGGLGESSGRLPLWRAALNLAGQAAPFGLGTGGFTIAAGFGERRGLYPHNHALEALAETGLPGLMLWLLAFGGAAVAALRLGTRVEAGRTARIAALALPVALSILVSTDLGNRMVWFVLGLVLSLGLEAERPEAPRHV